MRTRRVTVIPEGDHPRQDIDEHRNATLHLGECDRDTCHALRDVWQVIVLGIEHDTPGELVIGVTTGGGFWGKTLSVGGGGSEGKQSAITSKGTRYVNFFLQEPP